MHLNLHDLYTHCLYPHHAECIETQLILMYPGIIMHDCKKKGAVPSKILIKNSIKFNAGPTPNLIMPNQGQSHIG